MCIPTRYILTELLLSSGIKHCFSQWKWTSETQKYFYQTTRRHIPEDISLHSYTHENVKSRILICPFPVWPLSPQDFSTNILQRDFFIFYFLLLDRWASARRSTIYVIRRVLGGSTVSEGTYKQFRLIMTFRNSKNLPVLQQMFEMLSFWPNALSTTVEDVLYSLVFFSGSY